MPLFGDSQKKEHLLKPVPATLSNLVRYGPVNCWLARRVVKSGKANQRTVELAAFLKVVRRLRPRVVLEIGLEQGGSMWAWSRVAHPEARLIGIDAGFPSQTQSFLSHHMGPQQQLTLVEGRSQSEKVINRIKGELDGRPLDFLFIDGDHSYNGVAADFENYAPMVRKGGLIGFHDIQPDYRTRFGRATHHHTGQVPLWFSEIQQRLCNQNHHRTSRSRRFRHRLPVCRRRHAAPVLKSFVARASKPALAFSGF